MIPAKGDGWDPVRDDQSRPAVAQPDRISSPFQPLPPHKHAQIVISSAASKSSTCTSQDYTAAVIRILHEHFGSEMTMFMYDPLMLSLLAKDAAEKRLGDDDTFSWHINKLRAPPVDPVPMRQPAQVLRLAKRMISVSIGRLHRDSELAMLYAHTCGRPVAQSVFQRSLIRVVESNMNYMYTLMQLAIDMMDTASRKAMVDVMKSPTFLDQDGVADILTVLMGAIAPQTTVQDVESMLAATPEQWLQLVNGRRQAVRQASGDHFVAQKQAKQIAALFPLDYESEHYGAQRPVNGKFWNMIRPTASCTSLVRLCEKPDGCRLLCNAEYLLHAGLSQREQRTVAPYHHRLAGFGSNNEYDWETSLVHMFAKAKRAAPNVHRVGWFTVFDCTVGGTGARAWAPPAELTNLPIGFGYGSKCLDGSPTSTAFSIREMKSVLLSSEAAVAGGRVHEIITRRKVSDEALQDAKRHSGDASRLPHLDPSNRLGPGQPRYFDGISILKVDVEGYEFNAIPAWAKDELVNLGESLRAKPVTDELITFEDAIDRYFSVSLLSMEFHRSGHKYPHGAGLKGALRAHYTVLHLYSLGFLMVGQEKNHQDNCCYELVWVHQRHFIRSEVWMVTGDGF